MRAVYLSEFNRDSPLDAVIVGERPDPVVPDGWTTITVKAASINHHDLWSTRGVGLSSKALPMIMGLDASGIDEQGNEVITHGVISSPDWRRDETLDPKRSLLSEHAQGTFAEKVTVPRRNVIPKPEGMSFEEAACLGTSWLTAYRMLFTQSGLQPGGRVLVQGASGGVATSLIRLASAAGMEVYATTRDLAANRDRALALGATEVLESGTRLPTRVEAVMENVGAATWSHSIRSLRPGGTLVICGATTGEAPTAAELSIIFFQQLRVQGSTMGTVDELGRLVRFMDKHDISPLIDRVLPLEQATEGLAAMENGDVFGKIVLTI